MSIIMTDYKMDNFYQYNNYKTNQIMPDTNNLYFRSGINGSQSFEVVWKELSYRVPRNFIRHKTIINNISGFFKSGQIMAIMGPSGCGKSTLLGCLSGGKKKGLSGSITISSKRKMKFAFIPQDDYLDAKLSVKEALMYASKLKTAMDVDHKLNVQNVIKKLNIENCADVRTNRCSGGQRKRISIALELVSRPNILILDEPTSGLDSVTTWQLINTLIELTKQKEPLAVVATIHQPSGKLFNLFNSIYVMSHDGQCIYHGSPLTMVNFLSQYGLKCPPFHNPSDYVLEVASKEHGIGKVMLLSSIMKIEALDLIPHENPIQSYRIYRTCNDVWTLTKRCFKVTIRDKFMLPIRIVSHVLIVALIALFWGEDSGKLSGCPEDFVSETGSFAQNYIDVSQDVIENFACLTFLVMMVWFGAIFAVLMTFPLEMNVFIKEYKNGWYSCFSYYMSKVLVDLFFQLTIPNLISIPGYIYTGQYYKNGEEWRLVYFVGICLLLALSSTSMGLMVSAWLMKWPTAAAFIGLVFAFPMFLLSGFMIPIKDMPEVFQWLTYGNFIRFSVETAGITVYGFDRCKSQTIVQNKTDLLDHIPEDKLIKIITSNKINSNALFSTMNFFVGQQSTEAKSVILRNMDWEDNDFYRGIGMLVVIMFAFKVLTYLFLLNKLRKFN